MLREVKNAHPSPMAQSYSITTTATPSITAPIGTGDAASLTRASAGVFTVGLKNAYGTTGPILALTAGVAAANGSQPVITTAQTNSSLPISLLNTAGSGVDGTTEAWAFGWRGNPQVPGMAQVVAGSKDRERIIFCKVNGTTGAIVFGRTDFTCTRTAQGVLSFTIKRAFARTPVVLATSVIANATGQRIPKLTAKSASSFTVETRDRGPNLFDASFVYIVAVGVDSAEETCSELMALRSSQRKPRIVAGRVTYSGGTPSVTIGAGDFTVADTGTGVCTVTLTKPFAREMAVFGAGRSTRISLESSASASSFVLNSISASAGTLADPTSFDFIAIGSDDLTEY